MTAEANIGPALALLRRFQGLEAGQAAQPFQCLEGSAKPATTEPVLDPTFAEAIEYIGGAVFDDVMEGETTQRVVVSQSPKLVQALRKLDKRFGFARVWYPSIDDIDPDHYGYALDLYYERRSELERPAKRPPQCRKCKAADAVVEVYGSKAMCQPCFDGFPIEFRPFEHPLPLRNLQCRRCDADLVINDNLVDQFETVGRFAELCEQCWKKRSLVTDTEGHVIAGGPDAKPRKDDAPTPALESPHRYEMISGTKAGTSVVATAAGRARRDLLGHEQKHHSAPAPVADVTPQSPFVPQGVRSEEWYCRDCGTMHRQLFRTLDFEGPLPNLPTPYGYTRPCVAPRKP